MEIIKVKLSDHAVEEMRGLEETCEQIPLKALREILTAYVDESKDLGNSSQKRAMATVGWVGALHLLMKRMASGEDVLKDDDKKPKKVDPFKPGTGMLNLVAGAITTCLLASKLLKIEEDTDVNLQEKYDEIKDIERELLTRVTADEATWGIIRGDFVKAMKRSLAELGA